MEPEIPHEWIDRYNENELDEDEKAIFQKRMTDNPLLRSEVYIDACLNRFLKDVELQDLMKKINVASHRHSGGSRLRNYLLVLATVLCLAMIFGIFYLVRTHTETPPRYFQKDSLQHSANRGFTGKNFESLAGYELLIGSGARSDQLRLISPNVSDIFLPGSEIGFVWQDYHARGQISLVIMDNQGITLSRISLHNASSYMLKTKELKAGLYYWMLMQADKMVLMGKFILKPPSPPPPKRPGAV